MERTRDSSFQRADNLGSFPQIRRVSPKASQEDGNHTTCQIRLHILRKDNGQKTLGGHLELQVMQEDCSWRSIHGVVRLILKSAIPTDEGEFKRHQIQLLTFSN